MGRNTYYNVKPAFVVDPGSIARNSGRVVDWDSVPESYRQGSTSITASSTAGGAYGATSVDVQSIPVDMPAGKLLDFGTWASVTVTASTAAAGTTQFPVAALAGTIPSGALLNFGTGVIAELSAKANSGATSLAVVALGASADTGLTATFAGGPKLAELSANVTAATTFTTLPVNALALPVEASDVAVINGTGAKTLPAGKVIAELSGGKIVPRSDRPGSEVASGFLETNAIEGDISHAKTGYGVIVGGVLYENLLPDATGGTTGTISQDYKNELASATNGNALGFAFEQYQDNRT